LKEKDTDRTIEKSRKK